MSATNSFKGKFQEGTFAHGQGPIHGLSVSSEGETKGQLESSPSEGRHLKTAGGSGGDGLQGRSEEKGFDIYGASYKGPQNLKPIDKGEVPNFDVNK